MVLLNRSCSKLRTRNALEVRSNKPPLDPGLQRARTITDRIAGHSPDHWWECAPLSGFLAIQRYLQPVEPRRVGARTGLHRSTWPRIARSRARATPARPLHALTNG